MNGHGEDTLPVTLLAPDAGQAGPPPHGTRRSWPDAVHQAPCGAGNQGKGGFNHHFFDFPGVLQAPEWKCATGQTPRDSVCNFLLFYMANNWKITG